MRILILLASVLFNIASGQTFTKSDTLLGSNTQFRDFWDVQRYDVTVEANHSKKSLLGKNKISFNIIKDVTNPTFQIDLQEPMKYDRISSNFKIISKKREDMGCMIELKGQACRQYEWYFENEQKSSWRDFFIRCFEYERTISQSEGKYMNIPRLDIALDEKYNENGNFELGKLVDLWDSGLVESRLTMKQIEDNGQYGKAKTIYFGSRQSAYHFCFYQKDIEQAKKLGLDIDLIHSSLKFKNRYEVRMCDDVALDFVRKSLNEKIDMARLAVWVINSKIKVFERMNGDKVLNREWYSLLGEVDKIGFSTSPGFFDKQYRWLNENVSGVTALIKKWESITGDNKLKKILFDGEISDKNWKKLEQARVAYEKSIQESRY